MHDLNDQYLKQIVPEFLQRTAEIAWRCRGFVKVVINCGMGEALADKKALEKMAAQLAVIAGQKPQVMRAKRAISTFKLRAGDAVGLRATLRGPRMYDFFSKFIRDCASACPRFSGGTKPRI